MGTTSEKLTYLNETKQELKQKINNLGGSIDDNTTFRNYANQLQNVYDNLPKTEYQEGTEVNLGVTSKGKLDYENGVVGIGQTEQDGTPTPSTPITINSVTGNQDVVVSGKSVFDDTNYKNQDVPSSGGFYFNNVSFTISAGTYRYGVFVDNQLVITPAISALSFKSGGTTVNEVNNPTQDFTITTEQASQIDKISLYFNGTFISTYSGKKITGVMIYQGTDTTYEPYITPTSYQLSLGDKKFYGIPNTDYRDELVYDVENDKVYKNEKIKEIHLTKDINWIGQVFNNVYRVNTDAYADILQPLTESTSSYVKSNMYIAGWATVFGGLRSGYIGIYTNSNIYICTHFTTSNMQGWKDFLDANDVVVVAPRKTSQLIEITDTTLKAQVKALYNAHSNNGTTIITSNGDLPMIIKVRGLKGE